jgi:hypothetical protein
LKEKTGAWAEHVFCSFVSGSFVLGALCPETSKTTAQIATASQLELLSWMLLGRERPRQNPGKTGHWAEVIFCHVLS